MLTVPRVLNRSLFLGLSWHNRISVRSKLNHIKLLLLEKRQLANSHPPLSLGNAGTLQRDIGSNVGTYFAKTFIETNCHFQSLSKKRGAENFRLERKKNFEALPIDFFTNKILMQDCRVSQIFFLTSSAVKLIMQLTVPVLLNCAEKLS